MNRNLLNRLSTLEHRSHRHRQPPCRTCEYYTDENGHEMAALYEDGRFVKAYGAELVNQPGGWFSWGDEQETDR